MKASEKNGKAAAGVPAKALMDRIFSPRQKELVFKKLRREPFTKTEREYYSRVVRKKLEAIASEEVVQIARTLIRS